MSLNAKQLLDMSQAQLDKLFYNSPAGALPCGEGEGMYILNPGTKFAPITAKFVHFFVWQGKIFDPETRTLRNKISPFRIEAIVAEVYRDISWFDGKESIALDYSRTSLIQRWIRDEIREITPNLYLGIVYWKKNRLLYFALTFPAQPIK
jgi:hypothetical protein